MKETQDMVKASKKFDDKIKSFCAPLIETFGISHFYHAKITSSGHFIGFNFNRTWEEYFFSEKSHLLIWPDKCQPCKITKGIRFLHEDENENAELNRLLKSAREEYSLNFSLQFVEKSSHCTEMYGFALNSSDPLQHLMIVKEMPLLRLFMKRFQEEFKGLYKALNNNCIDMPSLLGPQFHNAKNRIVNQSFMHEQFLQKIGIQLPQPLTERELDVIKFLVKGHSAAEIGSLLFLSKRTVEHHLERIKDKFCSNSKSDLIQKIRELESIGYFMF